MKSLLTDGVSEYLSEGDRDASIQLNMISQLCELVLLLLQSLQQTVDLLLRQHDSAVILPVTREGDRERERERVKGEREEERERDIKMCSTMMAIIQNTGINPGLSARKADVLTATL